jgi:hypothetical protein
VTTFFSPTTSTTLRVVTGVKPGELVIVDGLQRAFPGAPVTPTVLKVDASGMPIPAPPPPQAPPGGDAQSDTKK